MTLARRESRIVALLLDLFPLLTTPLAPPTRLLTPPRAAMLATPVTLLSFAL